MNSYHILLKTVPLCISGGCSIGKSPWYQPIWQDGLVWSTALHDCNPYRETTEDQDRIQAPVLPVVGWWSHLGGRSRKSSKSNKKSICERGVGLTPDLPRVWCNLVCWKLVYLHQIAFVDILLLVSLLPWPLYILKPQLFATPPLIRRLSIFNLHNTVDGNAQTRIYFNRIYINVLKISELIGWKSSYQQLSLLIYG